MSVVDFLIDPVAFRKDVRETYAFQYNHWPVISDARLDELIEQSIDLQDLIKAINKEDNKPMFMGTVSGKGGKTLFKSQAHETRDECIKECFDARPKARSCSTAIAVHVDGEWRTFGMDTRFHDRNPGRLFLR